MNELRKEYHNKTAGQIGEKARDLQTSYFTDEYVFWLEGQLKQLRIGGVVSSADYKHLWQLMDELNTIMWESYMIKGKDFGRQEGYKIMGLLEQWAERH